MKETWVPIPICIFVGVILSWFHGLLGWDFWTNFAGELENVAGIFGPTPLQQSAVDPSSHDVMVQWNMGVSPI